MPYTISDHGCCFIQRFEGLRLLAYADTAGIWTIGYGSTRIKGVPVVKGQRITQEQAVAAFREDTTVIGEFLTQSVSVPLNQNQVDALFSFCYNLGMSAFKQSTLRRTINGNGTVTEKMFTDWNKIHDPLTNTLVPVAGLTTRRKAEYALFTQQETV